MKINFRLVKTAVTMLALGLILGWSIFKYGHDQEHTKVNPSNTEHSEIHNHKKIIWTCSMHPQIRRSKPGKCPICGMTLVPFRGDDDADNAIKMSDTAIEIANVETTVVGWGSMKKEIHLTGKVVADERRLYRQTSHMPGRVEKLLINFTGESISKGQVIVKLYSPDLVMAQKELLEALKIRNLQPSLYDAAVEKLKNWKLTDDQIEKIISAKSDIINFPILANVSGYVTKKYINLGDHLMEGQPIYEVADLSEVWLYFDVYESDIQWVKKGDSLSYKVNSFPGKVFKGIVSYIDPVINPKTRVAKARVETVNKGLLLKPEMLANATLYSDLDPDYESIVIPKSSVMWTGKHSLVYVKRETEEGVAFLARNVELGASLGDSFIVEDGLDEGEEIVVHGAFSIDAATQLSGKPSMMNPKN